MKEPKPQENREPAIGDHGVCGFCGVGGGYLGDQGDESTEYLHSSVRTGEPGNWQYEPHPGALKDEDGKVPITGYIIWCGNCVRGLIHKWQRYDDRNLQALHLSNKVRLEADGLRWSNWESDEAREVLRKVGHVDDPAVHLEKLRIRDNIDSAWDELCRRAGYDLTTRKEWRP